MLRNNDITLLLLVEYNKSRTIVEQGSYTYLNNVPMWILWWNEFYNIYGIPGLSRIVRIIHRNVVLQCVYTFITNTVPIYFLYRHTQRVTSQRLQSNEKKKIFYVSTLAYNHWLD